MTIARRAWLGALPLLATPRLLRAQSGPWPNRPVRMIIPFPPGASTDAVGRTTAAVIGARIGQPVVAENRGGAGGNIGAEAAARSDPDGYTLLIATISATTMGPHLYPRLGYDPLKDLVPVARTCHTPNCVVARADLPVATLKEALDLARSRPGGLVYGSPGNGTSGHLIAESLNRTAGISMQHVPYRGTGPLMTDLLAGRLDLACDNLPAYVQQAREGKLKLLAITSPERWYSAPEVPTVAEAADLPGFSAMIWWGVQAPAGTPAPIIERVAAAVLEGFATPEIRERLRSFSIEPAPQGTADFARHLEAEYQRWGEVVRSAGIKLD
ncbi:Bug family tripartite tricarboxylate transporter substrate binding protein [Belnapia rosea]|uniref:Tripartite-type tricarboxylate transporter, receptor component TctC n=1 Tax=Belnapia rosea TaxID=938405 RepID=A0A1G6ZBP9_9PROT|nr:tripartite tricarboxylate transporter substrate binding protein [Belnapia rosea]SDB35281.1 Tripartite-type tricarboxylate transporter, receptor component TctC [Belnapia rosea]SDD99156.1 Tripartite-type tricarboxylate transporter, receptor component TctC [Belnapia rosea]